VIRVRWLNEHGFDKQAHRVKVIALSVTGCYFVVFVPAFIAYSYLQTREFGELVYEELANITHLVILRSFLFPDFNQIANGSAGIAILVLAPIGLVYCFRMKRLIATVCK